MTEIWDIARHVEEHPDDHEQRWRLAKKLYMAWEYRLALEHLQVLRNEWEHKVNVVRYLAATYYRLGRYPEAIQELEDAIEHWPDELGLREQLARVYEMAERRERAAEVWEGIGELDPQHPIAKSAVKRLRKRIEEGDQPEHGEDLRLGDSDSGIDLSEGFVCPSCGAQNSAEYDRCWQCHAALHDSHPPKRASSRDSNPHKGASPSPETLGLIAGITVVVLMAFALYLSVVLLNTAQDTIPTTLREFFDTRLAMTRVIWGVMLLVLWPAILWLTLTLLEARPTVPANLITLSGLALAALLYITTWLPAQVFLLIPFVPAVISLVLVVGAWGLPLRKATGVWALQLVLVALAAGLAFILADRFQGDRTLNPFRDLPALVQFARLSTTPTISELPSGVTPLQHDVTWPSTGSPWLDARAAETRFHVMRDEAGGPLKLEIQENGEVRLYEDIVGKQWQRDFKIRTDRPYRILVVGSDGVRAQVQILGLLPLATSPSEDASDVSTP